MIKNALRQVIPLSILNTARDKRSRQKLATVMPLPFSEFPLPEINEKSCQLLLTNEEAATHWDEDNKTLCALLGNGDKRGRINPGDRRAIYTLVMACKPQKILEIGTHIGASTIHLAKALSHSNPDGQITTVDILDVNAENGPWQEIGMTHRPADYLKKLKLSGLVNFVVKKSTRYLEECTEHFDFIFLNGNHNADTVYKEISAALAKLEKDGMIILHDYYPDAASLFPDGSIIYGPYHAIERIRKENSRIDVMNLSPLPWTTKQDSQNTSLTLLTRR